MTATQMSEYLAQIAEKDNNAYLLALDGEIAGVISLTADFHERIRHIGDLFIAVSQNFQGWHWPYFNIRYVRFIQEVWCHQALRAPSSETKRKSYSSLSKKGFEIESTRKFGAEMNSGI
jgi:hypothetical protein